MPRDTPHSAEILAWARQRPGLLQAVVQEYRFSRRQGEGAVRARREAARAMQRIDPAIADPMTHAMVLLEWMEQEHRDWFWRSCRTGHEL